MSSRKARPIRPSPPIEALHVLTLCAFAVAQPLFDLLGRNASFFVAHASSRTDVVLFTFATVLVPWLVLLGARHLIGLVSKPAAHIFHLLTLALLGALALTTPAVRAWSLHWVPAIALAMAVGVVVVAFIRRSRLLQRFISAMGVAVIAFPLLFLFATPVRDLLFPGPLPRAELGSVTNVEKKRAPPVTVVVFDELSLASIITPAGKIDRGRFPNIARLAERSTWYREATTSGLRTDQAVPAMLTGRRVPRRQVPSSFAYPENLFTLFSRTHQMHVRESVTQLCPPELCEGEHADAIRGLRSLFFDASVVYGHIVLPPALAAATLPALGDRWAGFRRDDGIPVPVTGGGDPVKAWLRSALADSKNQHEGAAFEVFLRGLSIGTSGRGGGSSGRGGKPQLSWAHVQVPHPPWRYLPNGQVYPTGETTPGYKDFRWGSDQYLADEVLQRSLLQTKFVDLLVGRMIDRLEKAELWDETMLVVTSDHGATWGANGTRRELDGDQQAGLLGVPMFVKYPHQRKGRVDKSNAEIVDLLPTVADAAGIDVPWVTHGSSLRDAERRAGKRIFDGQRERVVRHSFFGVRQRAGEIEDLFGNAADSGPDDLYAFGRNRRLLGDAVENFELDLAGRSTSVAFDDTEMRDVDVDAAELPVFFRAALSGSPEQGWPVVVALNGTIAGVGQTYTEDGATRIAMILSPRYLVAGRNDVKVYRLKDDATLQSIPAR